MTNNGSRLEVVSLSQVTDAPALIEAAPTPQDTPQPSNLIEQRITSLRVELQRSLAELSLLAIEVKRPGAPPLAADIPRTFYEIGHALRHGANLIDAAGDWATSAAMMRREAEEKDQAN